MSLSVLLSNVKVTGSNLIYSADFTGIGGANVFVSGNQIFVSGGAGGGGGGTVTQGQLDALSGYTTGVSGGLQAQIAAGGTQVRVSGSATIPIANFSGVGGTQVVYSGGFVLISGGAGGGGSGDVTTAQLTGASGALQYQINGLTSYTGDERVLSTLIPTGVDSYFINWTPVFTTQPAAVVASLEVTGSLLFSLNVKGISISGYTALFSNTISEGGVTVHTYARQGMIVTANERVLNTSIPTGIDNYFILWTPNYASTPSMIQATLGVTGVDLYGINIRNRTISGYTAIFSDLIAESGVFVNTYARF